MPASAAPKAKPAAPVSEASLGVFTLVKETPNKRRFEQAVEDGRPTPQYVTKDVLSSLGDPVAVEVIIRAL